MTITPEELERWKEEAEAAHGVRNPRHEADVCPRVLRLIARVQELEKALVEIAEADDGVNCACPLMAETARDALGKGTND